MSAPTTPTRGPTATVLIEEAVHLLRGAPAGVLLAYYAGTAPFGLGLMFFWAYTTWFVPTGATLAWLALGLVGLFALMKAAQALFCARLLALRLDAPLPSGSVREFARLAADQLRLHAWGLLVLPLAAVVVVPFVWVFAYFQGLSVVAGERDAPTVAREQAVLWPSQNFRGLLLVLVVALCVWVNLLSAFQFVPWVANRLLGIENAFGLRGVSFTNSTLLAGVTMVAWLVVDPLIKAFYTLRVFHGRARRTGEALRVALRAGRRAAVAALVLLGAVLLGGGEQAHADEAAAPAAKVATPAQLDAAIDRTLAGRDFQWRLRPEPKPAEAADDGPILRFLKTGLGWIQREVRSIWNAIESFFRRITHLFQPKDTGMTMPGSGRSISGMTIVLTFLLIALAALLIFLTVVIWRRTRERRAVAAVARPAVQAMPDLRDESTEAAQLPAEGWLTLAREQMARGEWRLALRALYLATLAQLGDRGLVTLAKFKTNLDYERELRRRALEAEGVPAEFSRRRRGFESVWYGREQPEETAVRAWLAELERPSRP